MLDDSNSPSIFESDILKNFFGELAPRQEKLVPKIEELLSQPSQPKPVEKKPPAADTFVEETAVEESVSEVKAVSGPTQKRKAAKKKAKVRKIVPAEPEIPFVVPEHLFNRRGRVFSVINQKGGCGKTTTAINLAAGLAGEGFDVLLVDIDAQANSTLGYGIRPSAEQRTVYHVFRESIFVDSNRTPFDLIQKTSVPHVSVLPSSKALAPLASEILDKENWEYILRQYLATVKDTFHYVVIDCPPALNALTVNALTASDQMIIPLQTHYFSLEGMKDLFLSIRAVQEKLNPLLKNGLILPTLFDKRARVNRDMLESIRSYFKDKVLESVIHMNVRLIESAMHGEPVLVYDAASRGAQDYRSLSREVIQKDDVIFDGKAEEVLAKFILQ